ncbi:hypothetical protein AC792_03985 [Arthrobacter sp. RIT-PI-e]|uniref:hypothetical protein n=1 Tax=Arthrobacter sp. RIT-PI-e TaxID=1681197 RepID=UPI000676698B|nr:hypothetical protein [Arthrobacter sp. RIT-PI-e]KNC19816.1 hypothetical protein AC792_03985 [Arthrobacter sp. RIT-PI-e]
MSTRRVRYGAGAALAVLLCSPLGVAALEGEQAMPSAPRLLQLDHSEDVVFLVPGKVSSWDLRIDVDQDHLDTLTVRLDGHALSDRGLEQHLDVSATACSVPFEDAGCTGSSTPVVPAVPLSSVSGTSTTVLHPTLHVGGAVYVRVDVTLAAGARLGPPSERAHIVVTAAATGTTDEAAGPGGSRPFRQGPGSLADTGAALLMQVLLALGAVVVGLGVSAAARRRKESAVTAAAERVSP